MRAIEVRCPQCGERAAYRADNPYRPFCSERCKLIDLGAWAEERYAIAGAPLMDTDGELPGSGNPPAEAPKRPQSRHDG